MGRYMLTRDWPVFEVIPLFMPVWLLSAMMASESDERYAFLRTLPVPDWTVARTKFVLILSSAAFQWTLMTWAALARMDDSVAEPSTLVYLTVVCVFGLIAVAGYQIGIWRLGFTSMKPVLDREHHRRHRPEHRPPREPQERRRLAGAEPARRRRVARRRAVDLERRADRAWRSSPTAR